MADVGEGRPGRQLASNLRELMKQVDIRTGTDRDKERERDADWASESQASVRDIFAKRRAAIPAPSVSSTSSRPTPRRLSIGSEVSSAPTAMYTPGRHRDELSDDGSTVDTPIARAPPQPMHSSAASLHALRARLENGSEQDTASDLTGWDRSARSLMTTRGQASSSRLHVYDEGSNLLDEDLGAVPSLAISHVDSTLHFQPSVGNTSRTPIAPRQRPNVIPKGPSLQSASLAERLAGIPDDGLEFDDTDREDFDRNRMDDDSDDLLHQENDLLRSSSPPPPDSPMKPSPVLRHARHLSAGQPLSGSWENVMAEGSVMSLPNVDERSGRKSAPANASGSGSSSKLMQAINDSEEYYQRSLQENSQGSSQDDPSRTSPDRSADPASRSGNTTAKSRLSTVSRSRLPLAKPATPQSQPKAGVSEISFPRPASPSGLPPKRDSPGRPTSRLGAPEQASRLPRPTSPSPSIAASESGAPDSPERPRRHSQVPVTPSRIPRVSMSASHTGSPGESPSRPAGPRSSTSLGMAPTSTPPRAVSSLGMNAPSTTPNRRLTPARSTSSLGHNGTPPETDVDRERNWGKALPKLTHANLRMRHESMESSVHSYLGGLSPSRGGSVAGRPTTPSFVGYARKEGSEVSSSQGSAGSDEDANLRRSRKMSLASAQGTKSGRELRGSSITSPTASSLARSSGPGLTRHSSLKTPSKPGAGMMRHSASFTGSPSASSFRGSDRGASPINSPRKVAARHSTEFVGVKDYERVRERDWGRPTGSRAIGVANVRPRVVSGGSSGGVGKSPGLGRNRVVSGGSAGGSERPESPLARTRTSGVRPRPHTIHFGAHSTPNLEELSQREPLDGGEEFLERDDEDMSSQNESVLEWRRQQEVEDLEEETEVEEERPSSPSPPSPSRSIPLPPSPPPVAVPRVQLHPPREPDHPTEASVSLFRDGTTNGEITPAAESTTRVSLGQERDNVPSIPDEAPPSDTYSPKRRSFAQPESPTISFMDTLPALPDPPSDEEISVVVPVRPSVNTRLNVLAREPSPGSASASEKTPRASTVSLRVPSPGISRTPTPPEPAPQVSPNVAGGLKLSGVEPVAQSRALVDPEKLEVPRMSRSRSRSNTLGTSLPRVEVNTAVTRDDLDSAATPVATRWMEQAALRRERTALGGEKTILAGENSRATEVVKSEARPSSSSAGPSLLKPSPPVSKAPSPLGAHAPALPATSAAPLQARHSDSQLPPMMSQKGKEILERMQKQAATLARDLEAERQVIPSHHRDLTNALPVVSSLPVPQGDEVQAETDQIVKLSTTARAERERLEKLRIARNAAKEEKLAVQVVPARRRSLSWILFSILMSALCAWLALYALSHHATNVYLDPLYPVLYGGDVNPLRHARTIDTFPSSWNSYLVPKPGIQHWVTMHLTPLSQKLWAIPGQAVQHLMSSWPPS